MLNQIVHKFYHEELRAFGTIAYADPAKFLVQNNVNPDNNNFAKGHTASGHP